MGQISSGIGLISGINFSDLIDQLLAIEARPITIVETQNGTLSSQQVALQEINSRLLAFKLSAGSLTSYSLVNARSAISSDETALTVSAKASDVWPTVTALAPASMATLAKNAYRISRAPCSNEDIPRTLWYSWGSSLTTVYGNPNSIATSAAKTASSSASCPLKLWFR